MEDRQIYLPQLTFHCILYHEVFRVESYCLSKYTDERLSIATCACRKSHLTVLEALHISCSVPKFVRVQKQLVQTLLLFSGCVLTFKKVWS